ncbi:polyphenol oxidase family protein [Anaerotardibacter muris]|uniref:polyphenol oxidase family protein n=1 Tax=Anaerotardibacter muris TaxID=2941505 RepID=UPI00203E36E4|nr:polyphenol oxidase family protein [Anaerotardibacter muris]
MTALILPRPVLNEGRFASIPVFTDDRLFEQTGVRIAFTTREGGVSTGAYDSLNLGSHVDDDLSLVEQNRVLLIEALAPELAGESRGLDEVLVAPKQVHGDQALTVETAADVDGVQAEAAQGADAIIVAEKGIGALLCFADCVPVIAVLPTGRFAVIHAGWRGVENQITAKTLSLMADQETHVSGVPASDLIAGTNIYIGSYIHRECFETSPDVHDQFTGKFGESCSFDESHIDLGMALRTQLMRVGVDPDRIADLDVCTVCNNDRFFSFRAQDGIAGRHGAFAIRL